MECRNGSRISNTADGDTRTGERPRQRLDIIFNHGTAEGFGCIINAFALRRLARLSRRHLVPSSRLSEGARLVDLLPQTFAEFGCILSCSLALRVESRARWRGSSQADSKLAATSIHGPARLKFIARPEAATQLEDSAGRARSVRLSAFSLG